MSVPRDDRYDRLSSLRLDVLRRYASFFLALPSTDRRSKTDLIHWILDRASPPILDRILMFAADGAQQTRRLAQDGHDEDERLVNRIRRDDSRCPDPSLFLAVPSDAEKRNCYRSFYDATSNESLRSGPCGVCGGQAFIKRAKHNTGRGTWLTLV
jgi:hypothetical protein